LEERQKACRLYIDVIGDILEEHMRKMRVYMVSLRDSSLWGLIDFCGLRAWDSLASGMGDRDSLAGKIKVIVGHGR